MIDGEIIDVVGTDVASIETKSDKESAEQLERKMLEELKAFCLRIKVNSRKLALQIEKKDNK